MYLLENRHNTIQGFIHIKSQILFWNKKYSKSMHLPGGFVSPYFVGIIIFLLMYIRLCSNNGDIKGNDYFEKGEYTEAMKYYNEFLMLYPNHIKTLYNRGRCFEALGNYDEAANDYEMVLKQDPDNVKAILSMSQYHYKNKNYKSALLFSTYATKIDEQNSLAHYYKARAHHKLRQFTDALDEYNNVIDIDPDFGYAYFQRSSLMFSIGLMPFGCYDLKMADTLHVEGASKALKLYCR